MKKLESRNRHQEVLEQVFYHFKGEVLYYARMLLEDQKHAQSTARDIFASYFSAFSIQNSVSNARLELLKSVWGVVSSKGFRSWKTDETLIKRSIVVLKQFGLNIKEIEIVMGIRTQQVEAVYSNIGEQTETIQTTVEWENREELSSKFTLDELWGFIARVKRKRRRRIFIIGGCLCLLVAVSSGYYFKIEHLPAEKSHISLQHPLHLTPKGPIIHTFMWSGGETVEQWQNAETGQTKSVYHDKNLEEITYWENNNKYILEYNNGILKSSIHMKKANDLPSLFNRLKNTEQLMKGETTYYGIPVNVYFDQNTKYYVDKQDNIILLQSVEERNGLVNTSYYGYEYLQSVGYGFFDIPQNIQFVTK